MRQVREIVKLEDKQGFIKRIEKAFVDATAQGIDAAEKEIESMEFTIGDVKVPIDFNLEQETKKAFKKEYKKLAGSSAKIKKEAEKNLSKLFDITVTPNVNYKLNSNYKKGVTEEQEKSIQSRLKKVTKANKEIAEQAYREQYELYNKINSIANELTKIDPLKINNIDEYLDYAKKLKQYDSLTKEAQKKMGTDNWKNYKVSAIPKDVLSGSIDNVVAKTDTGKVKRDLSNILNEINSYIDNGIDSISNNANYKGVSFVDRFSDGIATEVKNEQDKIVDYIKVLAKQTALSMIEAYENTMDTNKALVKSEIVDINAVDKNIKEIDNKVTKGAKSISQELLERFEKIKVKIPIDANIVNSDINVLRPFIKSFESVLKNNSISDVIKSQLGDSFSEMEKYYNTFAQRVNETPSKSTGIKTVSQIENEINNLLQERNTLEKQRENSIEAISSVTREEKNNIEGIIQDSTGLNSKLETVENKLDEMKQDLNSLSTENSFADMLGSASDTIKVFADKLEEVKQEVMIINNNFENTIVLLNSLSDKMNILNEGINIKSGLDINTQVQELKETLVAVENAKSNIDKGLSGINKEISGKGDIVNLESETNSFSELKELLSHIQTLLDEKNNLLAEEVVLSEKVDSVENEAFKELREIILDVVDLLKYKNQYLEESNTNEIRTEVEKFESLSAKLKEINGYIVTLKNINGIKINKGVSNNIDNLSTELIKLSTSLEMISKGEIDTTKIDNLIDMIYKLGILSNKLSDIKDLIDIASSLKKVIKELNTIKSSQFIKTAENLAVLSDKLSDFVFTDSMKDSLQKAGASFSDFANQVNSIPPIDISALKQVVEAYKVINKANDIQGKTKTAKVETPTIDEKAVKEQLSALKKMESQLTRQADKPVAYTADMDKDLSKESREIDVLISKIQELIKAYNNLDFKDPNIDKQIEKINKDFEETTKTVKEFQNGLKDKSGILATEKEIMQLQKLYDKIFSSTKLSQKYSVEKENYGNLIREGKLTAEQARNITIELQKLESQANKTGNNGATAFEKWRNRMVSLASYLTTFASFYDIINMLREGITVVRELDTSLTEMRKVSDESLSSLQEYQASTFDRANQIGTTANQLSNSTADWMRLGESLNKASESASVSNILLNVSEFENIDDATQSLVSMSQAFKDIDKLDIVNKLNVIGNNFSISTNELASSLQRSAAALVTAGNDIDEAMALTVAGNAVTQNAETVGAGLRTISLRIMGTEEAKKELEEMGESTDDFVVQTKSKLQGLIKDYTAVASNNFEGFDILKDNGEYKSTYEILLGISEIYKEILDTDSQYGTNRGRALLEALAGKNRANVAASILQNPELLKQAYESANKDYVDSAQNELNNYLDSVNGKMTQIQSRAQEVAYNALDSETLKNILDDVLVITEGLANISKYLFSFPAILGTISGILSKMTGVGFFQGEGTGKDALSNPFSQIMQGLLSPALSKEETNKLNDLHSVMKEFGKDSQEVKEAMDGMDSKLVSIANSSGFAEKGIEGVNIKSRIATVGVNLFKMALEGLAMAAIVMGIQLIAKAIDEIVVTEKEAQQASESLSSSLKTLNDAHNSNLQTINSVKDRYYELSKGVNDLGNNVSLTTDEYKEYKGLVSQISDVMPELTNRYNEQGEKVGFLTGNLKDLNEELAKQEQLEYSKLLSKGETGQGENIDTLAKDLDSDYNGEGLLRNKLIKGAAKGVLRAVNPIAELLGGTAYDFNLEDKIINETKLGNKIDVAKNKISDLENKISTLEKNKVSGDEIVDETLNKNLDKYREELSKTRLELTEYQSKAKSNAQTVSNLAQVYAKASDEYSALDEKSKNLVDSVLSNMSTESVSKMLEQAGDDEDAIKQYINNYTHDLIQVMSDNPEVASLADKLFNFDFSGKSDEEIQKGINDLLQRISNILGIDANELKIRFGFEFVDENAKSAQEHIKRISKNNSGYVDQVDLANMEKWTKDLHLNNEQLAYIEKSGYKARDGYEALKKAAEEANKAIDETNSKDITIDTHINTVDTAKSDLATLQDSYADYKDGGGTVDVDKLNSISENIKEDKKAYQEFLNVLTEVPEDTEAVQEAYNKLVTSYIDGQDVLKGLTTDNIEYTASELKKMGVVNAMEVAESRLAQAAQTDADKTNILKYATDQLTNSKDKATYASKDFSSATATDIINLANEKGVSEGTRVSLLQLALEKAGVNSTTLDFTGDISNLLAYAEKIGYAVNKLKELNTLRNNESKGNAVSGTTPYWIQDSKAAELYKKNLEKGSKKEAKDIENDNKDVNYNPQLNNVNTPSAGNTKTPSTKNTKTKQKKELNLTRQLYDWIERRLDLLSKAVDRAKSKMERLLDWDKKKNATKKAIEAVRTELNATYKAAKRYFDYGKKIAKEEAKAAAKDAKKNGSKKQADKYGKDLTKKQIKDYTKLVEQGRIGKKDLQSIKDPRIKAFVDALIQWNDKAKACLETADDLRDEMADLYETLANNPIDKAAEQIEKLSDKMSILEKKSNNFLRKINDSGFNTTTGYLSTYTVPEEIYKNRNEQLENSKKQLEEYNKAYRQTISNNAEAERSFAKIKSSTKTYFNKQSAKSLGITSDQFKELKKYIKSGEEIPDKIKRLLSGTPNKKVVEYNEAVIKAEKMKLALETAESNYLNDVQDSVAREREIELNAINTAIELYNNELDILNAKEETLSNQVTLMEQYGRVLDRGNYDVQIGFEQDKIELYEQQREELKALLYTVDEYSKEWYEARNSLNEMNTKLSESVTKVYELKKAANEISNTLYDLATGITGRMSNEFSFLADLMEGVEDFNPLTHLATNEGYARLFTYTAQMETSKGEAQRAKEIVEEYNRAIENAQKSGSERVSATIMGLSVDYTIQEAQAQVENFYDQWRDQIKLTKDAENKLIEWEIKKLEEEVALAQEMVDKRKQALTAEKDLHDYQRSIQDATTNINNLQKQITVLSGDNSQEGKARVQALQKQLKDAQQNLKETEYDRYISDQQNMLDNLMEEYTTLTDEEKLHREELLDRALADAVIHTEEITQTIDTAMEKYGYKPEYAQGILEWLQSPEMEAFRGNVKNSLINLDTYLCNKETGVIGTLSTYISAFNSVFSQTGDSFASKLQKQIGNIVSQEMAVKLQASVASNNNIVKMSDGEVTVDNNTSLKVTAGSGDTTNAGGTGGGNGFGGGTSNTGSTGSTGSTSQDIYGEGKSVEDTAKDNPNTAKTPANEFQFEDPNVKALSNMMTLKDLLKIKGITIGDLSKRLDDYSPLNQLIWANTGQVVKNAPDGFKALANYLGVKYDNANTNGTLFNKLINLPFIGNALKTNWQNKIAKFDDIINYIVDKGKVPDKNHNYKAVNAKLSDQYGVVLGDSVAQTLASKYFGITDYSKGWQDYDSEYYRKLHELGVFAKGGLVKAIKNRGEDGIAMVRDGEGILTPAQTKTFAYELAPRIDDIIDSSKIIKDATSNFNKLISAGDTNVEATFQFDLENVTSASDIIKQIQSNNNVQNAIRSVTVDRIAGGSRLGVNMYK